MIPLKILIIDDERINRRFVRSLITEFAPDSVIREVGSALIARDVLADFQPDIVFLDVRMPFMSGFELLESVSDRSFELVFITAYSEYAIRAIKEGAADYLLKPIKKSEFRETLKKVSERHYNRLGMSQHNSAPSKHYLDQKLILPHHQKKQHIVLRDVVYLEADNSYSILHLNSREKVIASKSMARFDDALTQPWFFRIHKSYLINLSHFLELAEANGYYAVMDNGDRLTVSRYRIKAFRELLRSLDGLIKP